MGLYLIDKPYGENGLALAEIDNDAKIVLIQDGVYLNVKRFANKKEIYAVENDLKKRGLLDVLPSYIKRINYSQLVDLIAENKVFNFV
jgi:tRNA 2-thiouridine synthesizing protein B